MSYRGLTKGLLIFFLAIGGFFGRPTSIEGPSIISNQTISPAQSIQATLDFRNGNLFTVVLMDQNEFSPSAEEIGLMIEKMNNAAFFSNVNYSRSLFLNFSILTPIQVDSDNLTCQFKNQTNIESFQVFLRFFRSTEETVSICSFSDEIKIHGIPYQSPPLDAPIDDERNATLPKMKCSSPLGFSCYQRDLKVKATNGNLTRTIRLIFKPRFQQIFGGDRPTGHNAEEYQCRYKIRSRTFCKVRIEKSKCNV